MEYQAGITNYSHCSPRKAIGVALAAIQVRAGRNQSEQIRIEIIGKIHHGTIWRHNCLDLMYLWNWKGILTDDGDDPGESEEDEGQLSGGMDKS